MTMPAAFKRILLIAGAAACSQALAQGAVPERVDLPALMRLVRDASPRIELERVGVAQAEAEKTMAGALPNPTISYGRMRAGGGQPTIFDGSRQQQANVEIPLLIAGQRGARLERAERELEAARARVAAGTSSLAAEAAAAFVALLAAQEKARVLEATLAEAARIRDIVAGREAGGAASRYDTARVEVELAGLRARGEEAGADSADKAGQLAALLNITGWQPRAEGRLDSLRQTYAGVSRADTAAAPALVAAMSEEAAARSGIEVARRERWPTPTLNLGRTWSSEPFGAANFLGFSVEIPLLDARQGQLARAQAEARSASLRREMIAAELGANQRRLEETIALRRRSLERFEQDAVSRLGPLKDMAESAYRLGRGSVLELLDATRSRNEIQLARIDLTAALVDTQLRLLAMTGALSAAQADGAGAPAAPY